MKAPARPIGRRAPHPKRDLMRDADDIVARVRGLWRALFRNPHAEAEQSGITGPQVTVMACLVTKGPMTLTDLSRTLGMSHSSASGIIDRLEARELVRRAVDVTDRRRTSIEVTGAVRRYVRELEDGPSGRLVRVLEAASPADRAAIKKGLKLLSDLLGARHKGADLSTPDR
jgi:DNA-binding MarR family transcriptional regulator